MLVMKDDLRDELKTDRAFGMPGATIKRVVVARDELTFAQLSLHLDATTLERAVKHFSGRNKKRPRRRKYL
jgi:hypothetical protein